MAFNPFDVFRRNQRILFAGLTVVIMFMFVLSFGQGDLFQSIPRWLAANQRTGEVLAEVDGSKLYSSQVGATDARRRLANQYMDAAARVAARTLLRAADQALPKTTASNKAVIEGALQALNRGFASERMESRLRMFQQVGDALGPLPTAFEFNLDRADTLAATQGQLAAVARRATDQNDLAAAQAVIHAIELGERLAPDPQARNREQPHYFSNQPAVSTRDAVDFTLWLRKADDLGIRFTDADVDDLKNKEFYGALDKEDWAKLDAAADRRGGQPLQGDVLSALADEFRVRAAQGAVLGQAYLKPGAQLYDAPADFFRFYADQTAAAGFGVVTVPAANYVSKVTATPTEGQLRALLDRAGSDDADPGLAKVGLREPRRLKIASLEVTGEEPYYKLAAAEGEKALTVTGRVGGFLFAPPGPGLLALVAAVPAAGNPNLALDGAYAEHVTLHKQATVSQWYTGASNKVIESHLATPATVAGLVGTLAGPPLPAALAAVGSAVAADRQARLNTVAPSFAVPLVGVGPNLGLLVALGAPQIDATRPLPRAVVEPQLVDKFRKDLTTRIAQRDVNKFQADLVKLAAKPDDPAARKVVADFAAPRGLTVRESTEFRDRYTIAGDPGLLAVAAAAVKPPSFFAPPAPKTGAQRADEFGRLFFFEADPKSQTGRPVASAGFFKPVQVPASMARELNVPVTLAWRTAEQQTERLRDFALPATRAKVEAAWRKLEARKLARQAADELAKKCTNLGRDYVIIKPRFDEQAAQFRAQFAAPADQARVKTFDIEKVSPLVTQVLTGQSVTAPFVLNPSDDIPYPGPKMRQALLDARTQPPSTAVVLTDAPEETYYVAVLLNRETVVPEKFANLVYGGVGPEAGALRRAHQEDLRKQARDAAVALLKAEYAVTKESESLDKKAEAE